MTGMYVCMLVCAYPHLKVCAKLLGAPGFVRGRTRNIGSHFVHYICREESMVMCFYVYMYDEWI